MSRLYAKTQYESIGNHGEQVSLMLYVMHDRSCDVVSIHDASGMVIFSFVDTVENNISSAIDRLLSPTCEDGSLQDGIEFMNQDEVGSLKWGPA